MSGRIHFKERLDCELETVEFPEDRKNKVIKQISGPQSRWFRFLEKEIRIPLVPVVAAVVLLIAGFAYTCTGIIDYSETEMRQSRISVKENIQGGGSGGWQQ